MMISGKAILAGCAALSVAAQAWLVADTGSLDCSVSGAEVLAGEGSPAEVCSLFEDALLARGMSTDDVSIAVTVHKRGRIEARVAVDRNGTSEQLQPIAMDVVDRPLKLKDIKALAEVVAKTLPTA